MKHKMQIKVGTRLAVLAPRCTVEVDENTETVLIRPIDGSDDPRPGVDIGSSDRLEDCPLAIDRTETPATPLSLFTISNL